jgi:hypothetical protein
MSTWLRQIVAGLSLQGVRFVPGSVHVGFMVDRLALGQVFLGVVQFSCHYSTRAPYLYIIGWMNNRPIGRLSSET